MVGGNSESAKQCRQVIEGRVWNVYTVNLMVDAENVEALMKMCPYSDPDVFVIDIDGIDYYVLKKVLELGYRPKIAVVEYNSAFGPERAVTVPYRKHFSRREHPSGLFYGVSIEAWQKLFDQNGYKFVTVESNGVNAFFLGPNAFPKEFVDGIQGVGFGENLADFNQATCPRRDAAGDLVIPK